MTDAREPAESTGAVEDAADERSKLDEAGPEAGASDDLSSLEDDLLNDLNGVLDVEGGEQAGGAGEDASAEEADFDELDAFLEEFEQQQMKDAAGALDENAQDEEPSPEPGEAESPAEDIAPTDEFSEEGVEVPEERADEMPATLDEAESETEAPETASAEETSVPETEPEAAPEELDLAFDEPESEEESVPEQDALAMAASAATALDAGTTAGDGAARGGGEGRGGPMRWAVGALAVLGLLGAAVAVLLAYGVDQRLSSLAAAVNRVEQRRTPTAQPDELAKEALSEVRRVSRRVRELAVIVEGPMGHLRDSTDRRFEAVTARLDAVEAKLTALDRRLAAAPAKAARAKTAAQKPAARSAAKPAEPKGEWFVNLASYTNEAVADAGIERLRKAGVKAIKQSVKQGGRTWYRLRVGGFASRPDAEAYGRQVEAKTRFKDMWVSKE